MISGAVVTMLAGYTSLSPKQARCPVAEYGIDLSGPALVQHPGEQWAPVVAALDFAVIASRAEIPARAAPPVESGGAAPAVQPMGSRKALS